MRILIATLFLAASVLSANVNAATIQWQFDATFSAVNNNSLNIDGEQISMLLTFDDADVWQEVGGRLYFPTVAADVSITGAHTIALVTATPAILHNSGNAVAGIVDGVGITSYVGFIVDGAGGTTNNFFDSSIEIPSVGQSLLTTNLPQSINGQASINSGDSQYWLVDSSVTISTVPVPAAVWLFGSGLGLLGWMRRKA